MSRRTSEERRKQNRRMIILGAIAGFLLLLAFAPPVRERVLSIVGLAEHLNDVHTGVFATVAVILLIILAIVDNAEKLHFIWEIGHKLLGIDLEKEARHEREFADIPDDYTSRPELERELTEELAPGSAPKLVVFTGEHDSGKTTTLHYVIPRKLSRLYKGNIILCRGDLHSIETESGETDEQVRRRLTKRVLQRVLQHAEVPGHIGETIEGMSDAITEYFERMKKPWLIIIDQIDTPQFPYAQTLPALFGLTNTVLVAAPHIQIDPRVLVDTTENDEETISRRDLHMRGFTAREALEMFRKEVHQRRGRVHPHDTTRLRSLLDQTSPGTIQRLSDIYVSSGLVGVEQTLDSAARGARRTRAIGQTIVESFSPDLRHFAAGVGLFRSDQVSERALEALARSEPCQATPFATLRAECLQRRFLEAVPESHRKTSSATQVHYRITKLGRGIAQAALRGLNHQIELEIGAALLQYYRSLAAQTEAFDIEAGVPNILGMMTWAEATSALPDRDVVQLMRRIRESLIRSGRWELGIAWLSSSEEAAERLDLVRSYGELSATRAELLLAMGKAHTALRLLDMARGAFRESSAQAESNRQLGIGDEALLHASLDYDAVQRCWLTHVEVAAQLALRPASADAGMLEAPQHAIEDARAWLRDARDADTANAPIAATVVTALEIDSIQIGLLLADAQARAGDRAGALRRWHVARTQLRELRRRLRLAEDVPAESRLDLLARVERLEGTVDRRFATFGPRILRASWRTRARRHLAAGLRRTKASRLEGVLILLENAELDLGGLPWPGAPAAAPRARGSHVFVRLTRRWRYLQSDRRQLLLAHANAAALGALPAQFAGLMALVSVTSQLAALDSRPAVQREVQIYAQGATAIAERLREEMPDLLDQARALPPTAATVAALQRPQPVAAGHAR